MGIARDIERRLEQLVDGLSATIFRGGMQPVEIAERLVRQADLMVADAPAGPTIPNRYRVRIRPKRLPRDADVDRLGRELAAALADAAASRGWRIEGPITVVLEPDAAVTSGGIECDAETAPGDLAPWGQLLAVTEGAAFELRPNRVLVGRSASSDVVIGDPDVSRTHAVVFREGGRVWIDDLKSANGTRVNGVAVDGAPVAISPGDQVAFGSATYSFRLL